MSAAVLNRREWSLATAIVAICFLMGVMAPRFFAVENQVDLMLSNVPALVTAVGMTLVILTGNVDISVGSQFAVCGVVAGVLAKSGLPVLPALLLACAAGALLGAVNGALVGYLRVPSIVATLATMVAVRDALRWATQGEWIQNLPPGFQWFGLSQSWSAALTACLAVAIVLVAAWVLRHVAAGRAIYATGSDANAARLAGINPRAVVFFVFLVTGALTGFAAVMNAIRFNQIPSNAGIGLELKVIAAVVVGGAAIAGGKGSILGTFLGVVLLGIIGPALTFLGVSAYWERAVQGAIILGAVTLDSVRLHSRKTTGAFRLAR